MPWDLVKRGNKFAVIKKTTGETKATFKSQSRAKRYLSALYANTKDN